jgi:2-polyprenyl-6-methoxyphenol hydroxylase-like FAD-dependent oxidoreductase
MDPQRIAVVGAGTAGSAVGALLARAGHRVVVFERVADPKPVGAGITLQPTGQATLVRLGLFDQIKARGAHIDRLHMTQRKSRRTLMDLPYAEVDPDLFGIGIHRGVLFGALFGALRASPADVRVGVDIARTELARDGRYLVDGAGAKHGPYDLVVAADGGVCELHHAHPRVKAKPYGWGALWFVSDDVADNSFSAAKAIHQVVDGARHMLGVLPTGLGPTGDAPKVSLFWSIRADRVEAWRRAGLAAWRDAILPFEPRVEPILDRITDVGAVLYSRYRDVAMYPWHAERLVCLGDAAHATSPQLGQGANLALIDAVTFAECFAAAPTVGDALAAYSEARRRHLNYYQFMTRALTPFFQHDSRVLGLFRDVAFTIGTRLGFLRRRMVRTMLGIDRGWIRRQIPLAEVKQRLLG